MDTKEAMELLSYNSCSNDDITNTKWENGFLGSLRPFRGNLNEDNFHEIMACLKTISCELNSNELDKKAILDIFSIIHFTEIWALHRDGMLRRNNLISKEQLLTLEYWHYLFSHAFYCLMAGQLDEAFYEYKDYCDGDKSFLESELNEHFV